MQIIFDPYAKKPKRPRRLKRFRKLSTPAAAERDFRNRMSALWQQVLQPATLQIQEMVKRQDNPASIAAYIEGVLDQARIRYAMSADEFLPQWRTLISTTSSDALMRGLIDAMSIDIRALVDDPKIDNVLHMAATEASQLIVSIPEQYLGQVARAVYDNYVGNPLPEGRTLLQQMQHLQKGTKRRAELLARDQTKKLSSSLNKARQEGLGVEKYIWRTAKDERVVGKPGGKYPDGNKVHGNHYERDGKQFRWDTPPEDGHPGHAINCRCYAEPVIDLDALLAKHEFPK